MTYSASQFQFTHLLQDVYDRLEQTKGLIATGGTTATIVDSSIPADIQDDAYNGHTAFVAYDAAGAGAAPEGEFATVTDYTASTTTLSFATSSFTVAPAAGDWITLARGSLYPIDDVKRLCNVALRALGDVPDVDTSITTAAQQTEHSVPTGVPWTRIVMAEIQGKTTDANDNRYVPIEWEVVPPTSEGGTATLVFRQYSAGYTIRLTWLRPHVALTSYDDPISKAIHRELAVAACALACARWKRNSSQEILPFLERDFALALQQHPIVKFIPHRIGMPHWSGSTTDPGIPDPIS